ncbi:hypothetical protein pb186bvf_009337 [Paramecium bursaria]
MFSIQRLLVEGAIIIFMLEEILVNQIYYIYEWVEVFCWFLGFFLILTFLLWECQLIKHRPYMTFYFNSFYLGQLFYDSDILFPCAYLKIIPK